MPTLPAALASLRDALRAAPLSLPLPSAEAGRRDRDELVQQVDDHLLPRLARRDAPMLAVLGGSTGAGKSTLVNSLVGATVTETGVLRPTTRSPVLVCHPDDEAAFGPDAQGTGVLPDLPRVTGAGTTGLRVATSRRVPSGIALVDSPDIDSVEVAHHDLAAQLLGAADLWLFVTTAARYADAVPWDHLVRARERSVALAVVVNRVPGDAVDAVTGDLQRRLDAGGLAGTPVFAVEESTLADGRIEPRAQALLDAWLTGLAADRDARRALVERSLQGALRSLADRVERVADAVDDQAWAVRRLAGAVEHRFVDARDRIAEDLGAGMPSRDPTSGSREHRGTRWRDRLRQVVGRTRDRVRSGGGPDPRPDAEDRGAGEPRLVDLVHDAVDEAALEAVEAWRRTPGGEAVLATAPPAVDRGGEDVREEATREVEAWRGEERARADLLARVDRILDDQQDRLLVLLDGLAAPADAERIRATLARARGAGA